ncbi:MAG: Holliday junction branch migration protein RuvA [Chloroflexi bacterium]|nr:Holliday junction branch migration protein RuvA [Chloroflexota bacterium]
MISSLTGRVTHIAGTNLTLEIGGVGLLVNAPAPLLAEAQTGHTLSLSTYLVVRENELSLYGFATHEARQLFTHLIGVNGIGPRLALAILSTLNVATIRSAVSAGQSSVLSQVPGVGNKTAQKIVLHLADRIGPVDGVAEFGEMVPGDSDLLEALTSLGYSVVEAQSAMQAIPAGASEALEDRLKLALAYFNTPN